MRTGRWTYYVVIEYSGTGIFGSGTTAGCVVKMPFSLETTKGLSRFMAELREDHPDAIVLWWQILRDDEENNGDTKTEDQGV